MKQLSHSNYRIIFQTVKLNNGLSESHNIMHNFLGNTWTHTHIHTLHFNLYWLVWVVEARDEGAANCTPSAPVSSLKGWSCVFTLLKNMHCNGASLPWCTAMALLCHDALPGMVRQTHLAPSHKPIIPMALPFTRLLKKRMKKQRMKILLQSSKAHIFLYTCMYK